VASVVAKWERRDREAVMKVGMCCFCAFDRMNRDFLSS
jgi:hypothetical protein